MRIRYGRVNGRTRRSAGKSRDAAGASEERESRGRIIGRFYPKFPGWPSLVNSPAAVTGIDASLRKDAAPFPRGDQRFESVFLQRRVSLTGVFGGSRRKSPAFAGSVSLDVTRERDVLARSRLALAPFSDGH